LRRTAPHSPRRQSPLGCRQRAGESPAGGERRPMAGAYTVAQLTTIAAPLVVAALCLYAHRLKIGGGFLLLWAIGHLALAVAFAAIAQAPRRPDLDALPLDWSIGVTALLFSHGAILLGVIELDRPRL